MYNSKPIVAHVVDLCMGVLVTNNLLYFICNLFTCFYTLRQVFGGANLVRMLLFVRVLLVAGWWWVVSLWVATMERTGT